MWKIVATLPSDLKNIYDYDPYKKKYVKVNIFSLEDSMLDLKTLLKKCLMKIYLGFIDFSCDDF